MSPRFLQHCFWPFANKSLLLRLGYALQVMGQIRQCQGRDEESAALYNRSLGNYLKTIGGNHHRVGHVLVKIAEHEARVGHVELAEYVILSLMFEKIAYCDLETSLTKLLQYLVAIAIMTQNWLVPLSRRQNFIANKMTRKQHQDYLEMPKFSTVKSSEDRLIQVMSSPWRISIEL